MKIAGSLENKKELLLNGFHMTILWGFCVSQPLYSLLAQYPEFFVSHGTSVQGIIGFCLIISMILPLFIALCWGLVSLIQKEIGKVLYLSTIFILIVLLCIPTLKKIPPLSDIMVIILAVLLSSGFLFAYLRSENLKKGITICSPAIIIFPLFFLFLTPVNKILFPGVETTPSNFVANKPAPIIMVVFDELPVTSLQKEDGQINEFRYPNFASLADNANWFYNTTSVDQATVRAIPTILTGSYYGEKNQVRIPALIDYPQNLFTLLNETYSINAIEPVTRLSPQTTTENDISSLVLDTSIVYLHIGLPEYLTQKLPDITQNWENFATLDRNALGIQLMGTEAQQQWTDGRETLFEEFIDSIEKTEKPGLFFLHTLLPHPDFEYMPSGNMYGNHKFEGIKNKVWGDDEWNVNLTYQRHLLQLGYTDMLLGRLLTKLKKIELYDEALIIIVADHGASFRTGENRRAVTETNFGDIATVPLLIKLPGQTEKISSDRRVEIIDILPTIVDVIEGELPWDTDGYSVFDSAAPKRSRAIIYGDNRKIWEIPHTEIDAARESSMERLITLFGNEVGQDLWNISPYKELNGQSIGVDIIPLPSSFRSETEQQNLFQNVNFDSGFVPTYVRGMIYTDQAIELPKTIAIAVNGKIQATAPVFESGQYVSMLPESSFQQGENKVEIFAHFLLPNGEHQLLRSNANEAEDYKMENNQLVNLTTNETIPILPDRVKGFVAAYDLGAGITEISGWAADIRNDHLVDQVIIFANEQSFYANRTTIARPELIDVYSSEAILQSGFKIEVPQQTLMDASSIRLFAISEGIASELIYTDKAEQFLPQFSP